MFDVVAQKLWDIWDFIWIRLTDLFKMAVDAGLYCMEWIVVHLVSMLTFWVKPFFDYFIAFLPDPTGRGFRYVFEAYRFAGTWFDFDSFIFVVKALIALHILALTLRIILFVVECGRKLYEMIPGF